MSITVITSDLIPVRRDGQIIGGTGFGGGGGGGSTSAETSAYEHIHPEYYFSGSNLIVSGGVLANGDIVAWASGSYSSSIWDAMPIASATVLGAIKIGANLTIAAGVLSAITGSGGLASLEGSGVYSSSYQVFETSTVLSASYFQNTTIHSSSYFGGANVISSSYFQSSTIHSGSYLGTALQSTGIISSSYQIFEGSTVLSSSYFQGSNIVSGSSPLEICSSNTAVGLSYSNYGNLFISTNNALAANMGGTLAFGGIGTSGGTKYAFAKIHGKKRNATDASVAGYMAFEVAYDGASPYSFERMRIDYLGNVAIGSITPIGRLSLNRANTSPATTSTYHLNISTGSDQIGLSFGMDDNYAYIQSWGRTLYLNSQGNSVRIDGYAPLANPIFIGSGSWDSPTFYIDSTNHRVGIGTITPTSTLDIQATAIPEIDFHTGATKRGDIRANSSTSTFYVNAVALADMRFQMNSIDRMTILNLGNIGMGTSIPVCPLNIVIAAASSTTIGGRYLQIGGQNEYGIGTIRGIGFGYVSSATNESPAMIGYIEGTPLAGNTQGDLFFATRATTGGTDPPLERMRILGNGNVGIGTTAPSSKLYVSGGDIKCTGNIIAYAS